VGFSTNNQKHSATVMAVAKNRISEEKANAFGRQTKTWNAEH